MGTTKMHIVIFVILACVLIAVNSVTDPLTIVTKTGTVRGSYGRTTVKGNKLIYRWRSIPFAEPPVGKLRFQPPVAKKPWSGIMDVSKTGNMCIQGVDEIIGSEDCLFLKVYTTQVPNPNNKLPVMVWIYGGTFLSGFPDFDDHSVDYLLDEGVMVVTFHYRVGVLGFLSTEDDVVPGNNGIKDQAMALKWIKDNIQNFGGDPNNITIFGQNAGAASVAYLLQASQTQELFHRAILQSGSSLNVWSLSRHSNEAAHKLASKLNVSTLSSQAIIEGLRMISARDLQKASVRIIYKHMKTDNPLAGLVFSPVIEPKHEGAIIVEKSHELLKNGGFHKVPIMIGHTSQEVNLGNIPAAMGLWLKRYVFNRRSLVPIDMNAYKSQLDRIGWKIKWKYFGLYSIVLAADKLMRFVSTDQFVRGIVESARLYSTRSSVYYYQFSHIGPLGGIAYKRKGCSCTTFCIGNKSLLNQVFPNKWISRCGVINWPARSPDLIPLDYFSWGYLKSNAYFNRPNNVDVFKDRIRRISATPQLLSRSNRHPV